MLTYIFRRITQGMLRDRPEIFVNLTSTSAVIARRDVQTFRKNIRKIQRYLLTLFYLRSYSHSIRYACQCRCVFTVSPINTVHFEQNSLKTPIGFYPQVMGRKNNTTGTADGVKFLGVTDTNDG